MADPDEIAANAREAAERGGTAQTYADTFTGLVNDFDDLLLDTGIAAVEALVKEGYTEYKDDARRWLRDVQEYGADLSGNIRSAGARTGATDADAAAGYGDAQGFLRARINEKTLPYHPRVQ
jgi:hypothetical protein